jgi:CrcB protein
MSRALAVCAGGALGALARAGAARALPTAPGHWPWATFAVNLAGTLLLAWLTTRVTELAAPTRYVRLVVGTGFCGALTTFSTFQVETIRLARDGHAALGLAYATASMAAGMAVAVGATLALPSGGAVVDAGVFGAVVIMVATTTLITPPALKWSLREKR